MNSLKSESKKNFKLPKLKKNSTKNEHRNRQSRLSDSTDLSESFLSAISFRKEPSFIYPNKTILKPNYIPRKKSSSFETPNIESNSDKKEISKKINRTRIIQIIPNDKNITNLNTQRIKIVQFERNRKVINDERDESDCEEEESDNYEDSISPDPHTAYSFDSEKYKLFEVPEKLVLHFLNLVTRSQWTEALALCNQFVSMQPFNSKYREFRVLLQSLTLIKNRIGDLNLENENKSSVTTFTNDNSTDLDSDSSENSIHRNDILNKHLKTTNTSSNLKKNHSRNVQESKLKNNNSFINETNVQNMVLPKIK